MAVSYVDYGPHNPIRVFTATLIDGGECSTITSEQITVTVTGIKTTDILIGYNVDKFDAGLIYGNAIITADDTVKVEVANPTAGAITPTVDATYTFVVVRP